MCWFRLLFRLAGRDQRWKRPHSRLGDVVDHRYYVDGVKLWVKLEISINCRTQGPRQMYYQVVLAWYCCVQYLGVQVGSGRSKIVAPKVQKNFKASQVPSRLVSKMLGIWNLGRLLMVWTSVAYVTTIRLLCVKTGSQWKSLECWHGTPLHLKFY